MILYTIIAKLSTFDVLQYYNKFGIKVGYNANGMRIVNCQNTLLTVYLWMIYNFNVASGSFGAITITPL